MTPNVVFGKGHAKALTSWKGSIASARIKPVASKLDDTRIGDLGGRRFTGGKTWGRIFRNREGKTFLILTHRPAVVSNDLAVAEMCLGILEVPTVHPHVSGRRD